MGLLISFSGIDGAGKSTQVKLLVEYLRSKGKKVYATEAMFGYFLLKPLVWVLRGTTGTRGQGPVKKNKSILPKFWFILAFIDIWASYIFKVRPMLAKYDFVIADRFYTDIWANLLYYGYLPEWAFEIFVKLLPKADIAFMLQVNPKTVQKREREFPPDYYEEQAKIYKSLATQVNFCIISTNKNSKIVFQIIKDFLTREGCL